MTDWEQVEREATQRLLGAMVGKYGARLSEESEEQAGVLAFVALAALREEWERLQAWREASAPIIAALAIYGPAVEIVSLVEKARALNEHHD